MALYVYIAQSLDGYIAGPDGELDWLHEIPNPDNDDFGFADFMAKIDAVVMGKNTFAKVISFGEWIYNKPVYVASSSIKSIPQGYEDKVELIDAKPADIVATLAEKGLTNLYIDGGALIQSFLSHGLMDKLIITTVPVLLGAGVRLFGKIDSPIKVELEKSEILSGALVKNIYTVQCVPNG